MDEFRLMQGAGSVKVPVVVTSSVSPLFSNNPGYKVLQTQTNGSGIEDYQAITMSLQATSKAFEQSYDFQDQYDVTMPDGTGLSTLNSRLCRYEAPRTEYIAHYYGDVSGSDAITDLNWPVYYCGITSMREASMISCVNEYVSVVPVLQLGPAAMSVSRSWRQVP